jgi:hypothetical protein
MRIIKSASFQTVCSGFPRLYELLSALGTTKLSGVIMSKGSPSGHYLNIPYLFGPR